MECEVYRMSVTGWLQINMLVEGKAIAISQEKEMNKM